MEQILINAAASLVLLYIVWLLVFCLTITSFKGKIRLIDKFVGLFNEEYKNFCDEIVEIQSKNRKNFC